MNPKVYKFAVSDKGSIVPQGDSLKEELIKHKGQIGVLTIEFYDTRDPKKIIGYYKSYILPKLRQAFEEALGEYTSTEEAEYKIWEMCSVTSGMPVNIHALSVEEAWLFIREIKIKAAEELSFYID